MTRPGEVGWRGGPVTDASPVNGLEQQRPADPHDEAERSSRSRTPRDENDAARRRAHRAPHPVASFNADSAMAVCSIFCRMPMRSKSGMRTRDPSAPTPRRSGARSRTARRRREPQPRPATSAVMTTPGTASGPRPTATRPRPCEARRRRGSRGARRRRSERVMNEDAEGESGLGDDGAPIESRAGRRSRPLLTGHKHHADTARRIAEVRSREGEDARAGHRRPTGTTRPAPSMSPRVRMSVLDVHAAILVNGAVEGVLRDTP